MNIKQIVEINQNCTATMGKLRLFFERKATGNPGHDDLGMPGVAFAQRRVRRLPHCSGSALDHNPDGKRCQITFS
jgi:hypothetical protein